MTIFLRIWLSIFAVNFVVWFASSSSERWWPILGFGLMVEACILLLYVIWNTP